MADKTICLNFAAKSKKGLSEKCGAKWEFSGALPRN